MVSANTNRSTHKLLTIDSRQHGDCDYKVKRTFESDTFTVRHPEGMSKEEVASILLIRERLGHGIVERLAAVSVCDSVFHEVRNDLSPASLREGSIPTEFVIHFYATVIQTGVGPILILADAPENHAHITLRCTVSDLRDADIILEE